MDNRMTTEKMMNATLRFESIRDTIDLKERLVELQVRIKVFEAVVWFPRLQALVNGTDVRGLSGACRDIKIMTWCCAGRCLIQLERDGDRITLITADDEKPWNRDNCHVAPNMGPMGIQGIDAAPWEAEKMLYEVTRYNDEIQLTPDGNVSIG